METFRSSAPVEIRKLASQHYPVSGTYLQQRHSRRASSTLTNGALIGYLHAVPPFLSCDLFSHASATTPPSSGHSHTRTGSTKCDRRRLNSPLCDRLPGLRFHSMLCIKWLHCRVTSILSAFSVHTTGENLCDSGKDKPMNVWHALKTGRDETRRREGAVPVCLPSSIHLELPGTCKNAALANLQPQRQPQI